MEEKLKYIKGKKIKMENNKNNSNENNNGKQPMIRIILCVAIMIVLFLGMFGAVSKNITIPVSAVMLIGVSVWNGVSYIKSGKKKQATFTFILSAILVALLVGFIITATK